MQGEVATGFLGQYGGMLMILVMLVLFYVVLILPQKKQEKKQRAMLDALRPGDEIITIGGIYGKIVSVKDEFVVIESGADKTKIKLSKASVSRCMTEHEAEPADKKDDTTSKENK